METVRPWFLVVPVTEQPDRRHVDAVAYNLPTFASYEAAEKFATQEMPDPTPKAYLVCEVRAIVTGPKGK